MLVLSRRPNEGIEILDSGLRIEIEVSRVRGKRVRLYFLAPMEVKILREELDPSAPFSGNNRGGGLSLGRSAEEKIIFLLPGGGVGEMKVLRLKGKEVRLGFTFPKTYRIRRKELSASTP